MTVAAEHQVRTSATLTKTPRVLGDAFTLSRSVLKHRETGSPRQGTTAGRRASRWPPFGPIRAATDQAVRLPQSVAFRATRDPFARRGNARDPPVSTERARRSGDALAYVRTSSLGGQSGHRELLELAGRDALQGVYPRPRQRWSLRTPRPTRSRRSAAVGGFCLVRWP